MAITYSERGAQPRPVALADFSGDNIRRRFTVTNEDGSASNLFAATVRFVIAANADATPVVTTEGASPSATVEFVDGTGVGGVFDVRFVGPTPGWYRWECEIEDASGDKETVARGTYSFARPLLP